MKNPAKASDLSLIEPVISKYKNTAGSLITVLQEIQDIYGYLPEDALCHAAIGLGIAPATAFGVATFYAQFRFTPVGRYFIMLCQGTACHVNGSEMIEKAVFETLGIHNGETTPDGLFHTENSRLPRLLLALPCYDDKFRDLRQSDSAEGQRNNR